MMRSALQILILLVLLSQAGLSVAENPNTDQTIAIIAGTTFPKDRLTPKELKAIYLGEIDIIKNIWIHPVDQQEGQPIRKRFLDKVVNMSRDRYIDHWNQQLFRNGGFTPLLGHNSREVFATVHEHDGAVGYVWLEDARNEPGIKILLILDKP